MQHDSLCYSCGFMSMVQNDHVPLFFFNKFWMLLKIPLFLPIFKFYWYRSSCNCNCHSACTKWQKYENRCKVSLVLTFLFFNSVCRFVFLSNCFFYSFHVPALTVARRQSHYIVQYYINYKVDKYCFFICCETKKYLYVFVMNH